MAQNSTMQIAGVDISQIKVDLKSRYDIPKILKCLQQPYRRLPLRTKIFQLFGAKILLKVSECNGRPGMELWKIFVCGVVRLDLNKMTGFMSS